MCSGAIDIPVIVGREGLRGEWADQLEMVTPMAVAIARIGHLIIWATNPHQHLPKMLGQVVASVGDRVCPGID